MAPVISQLDEDAMMRTLLSILLVSGLALATTTTFAAPPDTSAPPAQQQKNQVPDSTRNGDYLEPQPDNNGAGNAGSQDTDGRQGSSAPSKARNMEKSKRFHEKPQEGGTSVKP